jgi:hypothetical protein
MTTWLRPTDSVFFFPFFFLFSLVLQGAYFSLLEHLGKRACIQHTQEALIPEASQAPVTTSTSLHGTICGATNWGTQVSYHHQSIVASLAV